MTSTLAANVEEADEFNLEEQIVSASEDEEGSDNERKHSKLLEAISLLGRKRKRQKERSEASLQVSEFSVTSKGTGDKVDLSDLLSGTVGKASGVSNKAKKQLKNLQVSSQTLDLPLNKQQSEKIQRCIAYDKTSTEVSAWQNVIRQNRDAEQLVFPLNQPSSAPKRVEQVVSGWKIQTPLEQEIFRLLNNNQQPVLDPVLTPVEEASIKAMSLEEAKIRRAELQKARALQSYYEAKAKREKKIKSRMYHKVQRKAKRKDFLKEFDEKLKEDPEGALEELKKLELSRMQERMSLKHQNSGKWAKSKAIMAKYDDSARKAMQEQLQVNKDLTQKIVLPSDDEPDSQDEETEKVPDFVNDPEVAVDNTNPWMRGHLTQEEPSEHGPPMLQEKVIVVEDEEEEEEEEELNEEEQLLRDFERKRKLRKANEEIPDSVAEESTTEVVREEMAPEEVVEISDNEESEEEEDVLVFNNLYNLMRDSKTGEDPAGARGGDEEGFLEEGPNRVRNMDDLESLEGQVPPQPSDSAVAPAGETSASGPPSSQPSQKKQLISLDEVLTKNTKVLTVPLVPTVVEEEDRDEQMSIIREAFAGDDVISDFLKDKRKQEEAARPKVVDLTLPGWGEWGGGGLKPSRHKRRRFRIKPPPAPPRKDQKLPDVIMSEKRNASVALHQVNHMPFPFQTTAQFESSIRTPVGPTWNTPSVVKKMTQPKIITRLGAIIQPIVKEDFIQGKAAAEGPAITRGPDQEAKPGRSRSLAENRRRRAKKRKRSAV